MASQEKLDKAYMKCAAAMAELSHAVRRKVGAIMVAPDGGIIAEGVNGTPSGFDNNCERPSYTFDNYGPTYYGIGNDWVQIDEKTWETRRGGIVREGLETLPHVLHAESNAIAKVARSHNSSIGSTIYCTLAPCLECAKMIIQAGVSRVVYAEPYPYHGHRGLARPVGLELLHEAGIRVDEFPIYRHTDFERDLFPSDEGHIDYMV